MKKTYLKRFVPLILLIFSLVQLASGQSRKKRLADEDTQNWRYEIQCVGTGVQGTYLIKVWSYSKDPKIAIEQAKKNAVHAIIFQGFAGGAQGCVTQKPLARNPNIENEQAGFFSTFFADGGKYMKYVTLTNDGAVGAADRYKIGKREYKIGVIVSVRKDELRKDLENAGIIRGLADGF